VLEINSRFDGDINKGYGECWLAAQNKKEEESQMVSEGR